MTNNNISYERYNRQMLLKDFGEAGQQKLMNAKVLVVGAGGLGCPVLQYLTAAGVGNIGVVDDDVVALTNLHRQILFSVDDIGYPKVEIAIQKLKKLNPDINLTAFNERLNVENAIDIISQFDLVVDGSDNFGTRYLVNDACALLNKTLVYGAVSQYEGQVAVFKTTNYRDLFPDHPADGEIQNCAEAGVLGVLPGIIGALQANEAIKLITGIGDALADRVLTYNSLDNQVYETQISRSAAAVPKTAEEFRAMDYGIACTPVSSVTEVSPENLESLVEKGAVTFDVREITAAQLSKLMHEYEAREIILFCQSGVRSLQAATQMQNIFGSSKKFYSMKGGIKAWNKMNGYE